MNKEESARELGIRVIILSNQLKHYLYRAAAEEKISGSLCRILHFLAVSEDFGEAVYQKDVEDFFCLRRSTVTQNLQAMEKCGLILRTSVETDARLKKLELTGKGRQMDERLNEKVARMESMLREKLSEEEITQFLNIVQKMSANMEELGVPPED